MEKFKATSKYSDISIMSLSKIQELTSATIIQIAPFDILDSTFNNFYVEYIAVQNLENYRNENNRQATASLEAEDTQKPKKTDEQMQLENDLETILNSDPFSKGKYSGKTLRYIYENDIKWVEYAIEHLNNTYIKDKLINIKKCESLWL